MVIFYRLRDPDIWPLLLTKSWHLECTDWSMPIKISIFDITDTSSSTDTFTITLKPLFHWFQSDFLDSDTVGLSDAVRGVWSGVKNPPPPNSHFSFYSLLLILFLLLKFNLVIFTFLAVLTWGRSRRWWLWWWRSSRWRRRGRWFWWWWLLPVQKSDGVKKT